MATPASSTNLPFGLAEIEAAARRIEGAVVRTPTLYSRVLSERFGADIWVKFENLQHTGAYKERGALNKLLLMDEAMRARGVIAASAGNHAQALAYHARRLGVPAVIVMPTPTPIVKVSQTEGHGAEVVLHGAVFEEAYAEARRLAGIHSAMPAAVVTRLILIPSLTRRCCGAFFLVPCGPVSPARLER